MNRDPLKLVSTILLILLIYIVFGQILQHEFINYDDNLYITENSVVQAGLNAKGIIWAFTDTNTGHWHPLTWLSHMLDCQIYGLNPRGHHSTSLLLHILNTVLLLLILQKATGEFWKSLLVTSLFALHPLHVESVAWAAERKDVLSTFFWMLTILTYVFYSEKPRILLYLLALLLFALGLMAKPMLVTLPFVLLLLDYWPLRRFQLEKQDIDSHSQTQGSTQLGHSKFPVFRLVLEKIPFFTLSAFSSFLAYIAAASVGTVESLESASLMMRLANGLTAYVSYIGKMLWPQNLAVFYPHPGSSLPGWQAIGAGLLLACVSIAVIRAARRHPYLPVGWLWYLGTLVPVIGLVQVGAQAIADRYTYVPLIGLFIMIAWGAFDLVKGWRHRQVGLTLSAGLLLFGFTTCTWLQVHHWKNSTTLFQHALRLNSQNYLAHNNLGAALLKQGKIEEGVLHYTRALEINPNYWLAHSNLGGYLVGQGDVEQAMRHCSEAVRLKPDSPEAHNNLGLALVLQGRIEEAITHYSEALRLKPDSPEAHNNLGLALVLQGRIEEAITHYSEALRLKPEHADAHRNLGLALAQQGRLEEAMSHYSEAVRFKPEYVEAHLNLAAALAKQGKYKEALEHYQEAFRIKPHDAGIHNNFGTFLAQQGKLDQAIAHFSRALELKPDFAEVYSNLGNVFKQQGKMDKAIAHYYKALEIKPNQVEAHNNLGVLLAKRGKLKEATRHYSEALRLNPDSAETHNNLAVTLVELEEIEAAISHYAKALDLQPDYAEAHNNLGNALSEQGKLKEAVASFTKALEIRPNYPEAQNNLGVALARQGRLNEAIFHFTEALRLKPDYLQARANLELALQMMERADEAETTGEIHSLRNSSQWKRK